VGSTSSATSSLFTGSSAFSSDLQTAIAKAVSNASAPITQLTNQQDTLTSQSNELNTLGSKFSAVQSAVQAIDQALNSSFTTSVSDPSALGVTAGAGATAGSYEIQVDNPGAYSTTMTGTWNGSSTSAASYQLWIGAQEYNVTPSDDSAASVASAINSQYGSLVNATVVNVGSDASPDYRLSLQSAGLTSDEIDLRDSTGTSLAALQNAGQPAQYEVNNSGVTASSDSPTVTISNGVTVQLLAASTSPVTITVSRDDSALSSALSQFATAYNAAATELDNQTGQSGGSLQGESIVNELSSALSSLATYSGSGGVATLDDLGLELGDNGQLTFDSSTLTNALATNSAAATSFLGSAAAGGFLESATNILNGIENSTTGLLPATESDLQSQITTLGNQISDKQTQVNNLQTQLTNQMSAADASISSMEQQYSYLSQMFQAMQVDQQETAGV
jgi:flagellar hook-associated protein 2